MVNVLVYAQDVGGTKCLLPVLRRIPLNPDWTIVAHPLSAPTFRSAGIPFLDAKEFFGSLPASRTSIDLALTKLNPTRLLTTLSSSQLDSTNSLLIEAARDLEIPSAGLLDHWKGYDRFLDPSGGLGYMTDTVACIDGYCQVKLLKMTPEPERFPIVGHPHLEEFLKFRGEGASKKGTGALLISQPDSKRGFEGLFHRKVGKSNALDLIADAVATSGAGPLAYRRHPKEQGNNALPQGVIADESGSWENALSRYRIFIGLDSMLLVEAAIAGCEVISLAAPEFSEYLGELLPYPIGRKAKSFAELPDVLEETIRNNSSGAPTELIRSIDGSIERALTYINDFLN